MEIFFGAFTGEWEQRRAALLHEMTSGGRGAAAEEEMRKRLKQLSQLGAAGGGGGAGGASGGRGPASKGRGAPLARVAPATVVARPMEARLAAVAKGSQPAVVKMASYGGGARVGAMLNYVSRSGELKVEDENGRILEGREELARVRGDWDHLFQNRAESRDIGSFSVEITGSMLASDDALHELVRSTLSSGFGDRRYAYAVEKREDGSVSVQGLLVLRSGQGERLTGDAKAAGIIQGRYDASAVASEAGATFSFQGYGNGVEFGAIRLRGLVDQYQEVRDDRGRPISDEQAAGDLIQKEWRGELHSRKSRDVMHVIMSARAGTDVAAFEGAARDFLAHQFAGHRYVFAMHDPTSDPKEAGEGGKRPHVHAHAIIAMKSDAGDRIETTPAVFREWRSVMAEKAREHGIEMEMTDRREFANPPAFTRTQVRPVSRNGRTEHVGTSEPAQARYDAKRSGRRTIAKSDRSRQYIIKAQESWQKVAMASGDRQTVAYAIQHREYLAAGLSAAMKDASVNVIHADFGSNFRANLITLQEMVLEGQELRETSRAEFEAYEKKVETALFKLERTVAPDDRADFDEVAGLARDFVNQKRELVELYEQRREASAEQGDQDAGKEPRDAVNDAWDAAVVKHGEAVVVAGNEAMVDVDHYREGLDRIEAGELSAEGKEAMQAGLDQAMERAAQMAIEGNCYLREVAKQDHDLQRAIDQADNNVPSRNDDREEVIKGVQAVIVERIDRLDERLNNQDSPNFISEDSYAIRGEASAERQFLSDMSAQLDRLGAGEILDLSRTEVDYGYDDEDAYSARMSGLEYEPEIERDRREHEGHVESVAPQLEQLKAHGVTVETSFRVVEPTRIDEASYLAEMHKEFDPDAEPDRQDDAREAHELASTVNATNRLQDRLNKESEADQRSGDTTQTDPAQQHVPRLEELEREQIEQRERDRDDRDR
ncbi:conjugal transfer protein TraA [Rhizobium sp. 007]|uniref:conjugal transfer protein TraA n=1 Tax=Rhizobium sp. 007 TaxID=2785056 RepID=UPI00188F6D0E|nr:conjugal transfer protein TraA [Rhizobium sp. 007]QPB24456.1 conjugal transfer protein TraA [Rhizobium sp. 007]